MRPKPNISPKKLPRQRRAIATVDALIEAATYILAREGLGGFTANKVAEKAGVNIASLYQYFPNKEALIFHIVQQTWARQLGRLAPILARPGPDHAKKLRDFLREFFLTEAAEVELRRALRTASIDLRETDEFKSLLSEGANLMKNFIAEAVRGEALEDLEFVVDFVVLLTTSFAERTTDAGTSGAKLIQQADLLTAMLVKQFGFTEGGK
ncbi:TetR/AcrR family transcriptional regulator [Massilia antarctica]|uniref:TetR/AcrR family transcriptional regulator n=1 Tax=Massilia antarctica TaxID=2765360 RepID=A0AA48WFS5_9BURK|nr:TetR/AcrR family transcriptional regulator [Massilia antarctica]QPI51488.1 TetR/AcrR family transcriptional regulator [Massilia antarctica]